METFFLYKEDVNYGYFIYSSKFFYVKIKLGEIMKIVKKENYKTLADQSKKEAIVYAVEAGICALGIVGIQSIKGRGISLDDGFLSTVNYVIEPVLGISAGVCVYEMIKKILDNIYYEKLNVEALKERYPEEKTQGGR